MLRLLARAAFANTVSAMIALGPSAAHAQSAAFYTVTYVEVGPILAKVGAGALKTYRETGRKDDGNASLEVLQRTDRPNQFVVLGAWPDQKAFEAHAAGANMKALTEKLGTTIAAPSDTRQHNGLSIAPAKAGKDPIYVVTHVDVIPPQKDNGVAALQQLADESRKHNGNLQFDVWQQNNRPNHFTVVEAWTNRGSFDVHEMQKSTRDFRNKLGSMTGALYDERLYKVLK